MGDCRVKLFGSFDNFVCQTEAENYANENKNKSVIIF